MLARSDPEAARSLLALAKQDVLERWKLYEYFAAMPADGIPQRWDRHLRDGDWRSACWMNPRRLAHVLPMCESILRLHI